MADDPGNSNIIIKKIKKGGHGHHGGAWKVAYADFVTAMMAFFLTMWIMGLSQPQKEGIQKFFNDPMKYLFGNPKIFTGIFENQAGKTFVASPEMGGASETGTKGGNHRFRIVADKIKSDMSEFKSDVVDIEFNDNGVQFAITAEALFSSGSALLRPESESMLAKVAEILKPVDAFIVVEAHTDDLPPQSQVAATNWELSALRAATVVRYFTEGNSFDPSKISAKAVAEFNPIADNRTPEGRAKNRRVNIFLTSEDNGKINLRGLDQATPRSPAGQR